MNFSAVTEWVVTYLVPILTAGNIAFIIGLILKVVSMGRLLAKKDGSAKELLDALKELKGIKADVGDLKAAQDGVSDETQNLNAKSDALLRVYDYLLRASTRLTDEDKGQAHNIINNAIYTTTAARKRAADKAAEIVKIDEEAAKKKAELAKIIISDAKIAR